MKKERERRKNCEIQKPPMECLELEKSMEKMCVSEDEDDDVECSV